MEFNQLNNKNTTEISMMLCRNFLIENMKLTNEYIKKYLNIQIIRGKEVQWDYQFPPAGMVIINKRRDREGWQGCRIKG